MAYPTTAGADPLWSTFSAVAGQDGQITVDELQRLLTSDPWPPFNPSTLRLIIAMLDRDWSGAMGFSEFKEFYGVLDKWAQTFRACDKDNSGTIDRNELQAVVRNWGYNLSPQFYDILVKKFDTKGLGAVSFDDFVQCGMALRILTDQFRRRDVTLTGVADITYNDFLTLVFQIS